MPRWWGPKELFISYGCLWFSYQWSNVSFDVFLRYTLAIRGTNRFLIKLCTVSDASVCMLDVQISVFFWSNETAYRISFFDFRLLWKIGDAGHRSPYLSHAKGALYHLSYITVEEMGAHAISNLSSVNAIVERSSFAYRSKIGFVDAGHQSMCFSHANRLLFRLTCLAGGLHRSCLCQKDVFDSLISRVRFPSTSFWAKHSRFGALIAFSASSVLFQMLPFEYWTYISMSVFDLTN